MNLRGSDSVTFTLEATRAAILALSGPEVAEFTLAHGFLHGEKEAARKKLAELNKRARVAWKRFDLHTNRDEPINDQSESCRNLYLDVVLASGTKVHAEWLVKKSSDGEWNSGTVRIEIRDSTGLGERGGRPYQVVVEMIDGSVVVRSAERYTGWGVMGQPTHAAPIVFV